MKEFHFSKKYFNRLVYDDVESGIRVVIRESPSLNILEEDYSLRVETYHEEERHIHRNYAIEHHSKQDRHNYPHLQFKFHTEEIGAFWIRLDLASQEEYKRAILGFIYKIKDILEDMERIKPGICRKVLVTELVGGLSGHGRFLSEKISESIRKHMLEFKEPACAKEKAKRLSRNPLLSSFLGKENVAGILEFYGEKRD